MLKELLLRSSIHPTIVLNATAQLRLRYMAKTARTFFLHATLDSSWVTIRIGSIGRVAGVYGEWTQVPLLRWSLALSPSRPCSIEEACNS